MSIEKNISKEKKHAPAASSVNHREQVMQLLDKELEEEEVPEDWKSKSFFIHLVSGEWGELVYCVVEGCRLSPEQYKMLFAIQIQREISYRGKHDILPRLVASWFYDPEHVNRLRSSFAEEAGITWDSLLAGCFFCFHADLPDPGQTYSVVDWDL